MPRLTRARYCIVAVGGQDAAVQNRQAQGRTEGPGPVFPAGDEPRKRERRVQLCLGDTNLRRCSSQVALCRADIRPVTKKVRRHAGGRQPAGNRLTRSPLHTGKDRTGRFGQKRGDAKDISLEIRLKCRQRRLGGTQKRPRLRLIDRGRIPGAQLLRDDIQGFAPRTRSPDA